MGGGQQQYTVKEHLSAALALAEDAEQKRHISDALELLDSVTVAH